LEAELPSERPIVAQVFGSNPDNFHKAAALTCELGFDGLDINMGCPDKDVVRLGGGASLIDRPKEAAAIVTAAKRGITDWANGKLLAEFALPEIIIEAIKKSPFLHNYNKTKKREIIPVSVKTRLGTKTNTVGEWAKHLAGMELANVTIHGRTLKQMYLGHADWEAIAEAAEIIQSSGASVLGNGDVKNRADGEARAKQYGLDGALIGRAALGNPWIFKNYQPTTKEKLNAAIEHTKIYEKIFSNQHYLNMRKHLAWYAKGFDGASELRVKLVHTNNAAECVAIISEFLENFRENSGDQSDTSPSVQ
jgi:tRNA-dihydrouridine synthase